jgi:2-haloacid dehalogenase
MRPHKSEPMTHLRLSPPHMVVFDVGAVLLEWNPRHLYRKVFADAAEMEWFLTEVCSPAWNELQDGGRPWADAEAEAIARHPDWAREVVMFRARWSEMVPQAIAGTVALLDDLRRADVPLYAITNFSASTFADACARFPFFATFRGIVVSGTEKLLKPDPRIYQRLAETYGVDLAACAFIDDNAAKCVAASALGMSAIRFVAPEQARRDLADLGFAV